MTCIVSVVRNGEVYVGGDSCSFDSWSQVVSGIEKVFANGQMVMGYTTSWRMGQLLRYSLTVPDHDPRDEDMKYLVVNFMDAVRECFRGKGYIKKDNEVESGGTWLIAYKGKIYYVGDDFHIDPRSQGYAACGCGAFFAEGALHYLVNNQPDMPPEEIIKHALDAASTHSTGVSPPYMIMRLNLDGSSVRVW